MGGHRPFSALIGRRAGGCDCAPVDRRAAESAADGMFLSIVDVGMPSRRAFASRYEHRRRVWRWRNDAAETSAPAAAAGRCAGERRRRAPPAVSRALDTRHSGDTAAPRETPARRGRAKHRPFVPSMAAAAGAGPNCTPPKIIPAAPRPSFSRARIWPLMHLNDHLPPGRTITIIDSGGAVRKRRRRALTASLTGGGNSLGI